MATLKVSNVEDAWPTRLYRREVYVFMEVASQEVY